MNNKVLIIAEAGVNHNGDFEMAKKLVDVAATAGADFVKFQTFTADRLVTRNAKKADYQQANFQGEGDSQYGMLKKLEMPEHWHVELIEHCKKRSIRFLSTGFDEDSIDFLDRLGVEYFKVPSGEITNKPYLQHIGKKNRPVILSTGMSNLKEIREAIAVLEGEGLSREQMTVLHCTTEYPTPYAAVNLLAMQTIRSELQVRVGYSDHTLGIEIPIAAVSLGAVVVEKHFTLNRSLPGPDHRASLEPDELTAMVRSIRNVTAAVSGDGTKEPTASEKRNILVARKSIHYSRNLQRGDVIQRGDLLMLRPGDGISPMEFESIVGLKLAKNVAAFEQTKKEDFI